MALFKCPECGGLVSDRAKKCPHCGCSLERIIVLREQQNSNDVVPDKNRETPKRFIETNEKISQEPIGEIIRVQEGVDPEEVRNKCNRVKRIGLWAVGLFALVALLFLFFPRPEDNESDEMTSPGEQLSTITKTDIDTVSYMLGYSFGMQIVQSDLGPLDSLNMCQIINGIKDAGTGANDIDYEQFQRVVNGYLEKRGAIFSEEIMSEVVELCKYAPDHGVAEGSEKHLTRDFYRSLTEAFAAPVNEYYGIGENEELFYLFDYQDGIPKFNVKSVRKINRESAKAVVNVVITGADGEVWRECGDYEMSLALEDGRWRMSDFGGFNQKCKDYVKDLRKRYKSGEIIKEIMSEHESEEEANKCAADFKRRLEEFYEQYGR